MADFDRDLIRAALLEERARLLADVEETVQAPGQMTYGSQAAAASHVFEQQRDLALRDRATQHLELVDAALVRLDDGSFGACLRCGRPIAPARLDALPWAAHCIECQTAIDRDHR
ncbi:MAG: TraR/DksA family transcriptional regulator [Gemmatimonadota bacterium]|nr:TraR/DksA family transcriptional regulator [Chloroflexota bacterium]MDH5196702.1 TraR/DksA family transcriptional regulator [Gemmatimonadota bacterium]